MQWSRRGLPPARLLHLSIYWPSRPRRYIPQPSSRPEYRSPSVVLEEVRSLPPAPTTHLCLFVTDCQTDCNTYKLDYLYYKCLNHCSPDYLTPDFMPRSAHDTLRLHIHPTPSRHLPFLRYPPNNWVSMWVGRSRLCHTGSVHGLSHKCYPPGYLCWHTLSWF